MIVVADTAPLISLMKIGQLGLVERLFGEVLNGIIINIRISGINTTHTTNTTVFYERVI